MIFLTLSKYLFIDNFTSSPDRNLFSAKNFFNIENKNRGVSIPVNKVGDRLFQNLIQSVFVMQHHWCEQKRYRGDKECYT